MGLGISGFPNLFLVTGPGSPSVLTNMMTSIQQHVDWIVTALDHMRSQGFTQVVADRADEQRWMDYAASTATQTLRGHPGCRSWYTGDNVKGKPRVLAPFSGGFDVYTQKLESVTQDGYKGFHFS